MNAEEYFRKHLGKYTKSGIYLDKDLRFKTSVIAEIMEEYHQTKLKLLGIGNVSESFSKDDLLDLGGWFDGSPEFVEEVVNDWLNAR